MKTEKSFEQILALADIRLNGKRPHDLVVHDKRLYGRVLRDGELGLGESYMDGWWDSPRVDEMIEHLLAADLDKKVKPTPGLITAVVRAKLFNQQTVNRTKRDVSHHYNIGNDLYEKMLDKEMIYSCGYWATAKNLDQAQQDKLELVCRKLQLKKGMTLLDIGCGWGGFAAYAAKNYGVKVTGISPAAEQVKIAKLRTKGLNVKILQKDYRDVTGSYDRIVSIGMLEHVGLKNYANFFDVCNQRLAPGGLMLHHTIANNHQDTPKGSRWIRRYIFPGTALPTLIDFSKAIEWKFVIEDLHNFGPYYDTTLLAWHRNFIKSYPTLDHDRYDERFFRMWSFYLLSVAAAFRTRKIQLWQIVMRRIEPSTTYKSVR